MTTHELIGDFMKQKRVAVVGVSRNPRDFSRMLYREFLKEGYDAVPVNPQAEEVEGRQCFASLSEISPPVEGALLMTPPTLTEEMVRQCAESGISRVWIYGTSGKSKLQPGALGLSREKGVRLVEGYCPFMFFNRPGFIHRAHRFCMKLLGSLPA